MAKSVTPVKTIQIRPTVIGCVLLIISVFYFLTGPDTGLSLISVLLVPHSFGSGQSGLAFVLNFACTMAGLVMLFKGGVSVAIASWISNKQAVFMAFKTQAQSAQKIRKFIVIGLFVLAALTMLMGLSNWMGYSGPPFQSARLFLILVSLAVIGLSIDEKEAEQYQAVFYDHNAATRVSMVQLYTGQYAYLLNRNTGRLHLQHPESVINVSYSRAYLFFPGVFAPKYEMEMLTDSINGNLYYNLRATINDARFPSMMTAAQFSNLTRSVYGPEPMKGLVIQVVGPFNDTLEAMRDELLKTIRDYVNREQNIFQNQKLEQITASEERVRKLQDFIPISKTISHAINHAISELCGVTDLVTVSLVIKLDENTLIDIEKMKADMMEAQRKIRDSNIDMTQGPAAAAVLSTITNPTASKSILDNLKIFTETTTGNTQTNHMNTNKEPRPGSQPQKGLGSIVKYASTTIIDTLHKVQGRAGWSEEAGIQAIHEALPDFFYDYSITIDHFYRELVTGLREAVEQKSDKDEYRVAAEIILKHIAKL